MIIIVLKMGNATMHAWANLHTYTDVIFGGLLKSDVVSKTCFHEIQAPGLLELQTNHGRSYFFFSVSKKTRVKHGLNLNQIKKIKTRFSNGNPRKRPVGLYNIEVKWGSTRQNELDQINAGITTVSLDNNNQLFIVEVFLTAQPGIKRTKRLNIDIPGH